jgi:hypothetical protein
MAQSYFTALVRIVALSFCLRDSRIRSCTFGTRLLHGILQSVIGTQS